MLDYFYSQPPSLQKNLDAIDKLRIQLTFLPLTHSSYQKLRWETQVNEAFAYLRLENQYVDKGKIEWLYSPQEKSTGNNLEKLVTHYKKTHDLFFYEWFGNQNQFSFEHLQQLIQSLTFSKMTEAKETVNQVLNYIQSPSEHPVVQSALSYITFIKFSPTKTSHHYLASLMADIVQWKYGYDWKQLLSIGDYFYNDSATCQRILNESARQKNITIWIDYFLTSVVDILEKTIERVKNVEFNPGRQFNLSSRQIETLSLLDHPNSTITNKDLQQRFNISQITASRELAKLSSIGLLLAIGKGRSVRYIKT